MLKRIKNIYRSILSIPIIHRKINEIMWADIYRETIKDVPWLKTLSISPGDMAANFSLLYILVRILKENKIESVLEFGLGQSTRIIESFNIHTNKLIKHDVIEDNDDWINTFEKNRTSKYSIISFTRTTINKHNHSIQIYDKLQKSVKCNYDLYLIDGPRGLPRYSRYDICILAAAFNRQSQFIIIIDDYNREGEKQTVSDLIYILDSKNITVHKKEYSGTKDQLVITTEFYKNVITY